MKTIITQSNYIPWKGYFDAINSVDTMVLFDDMQYTKRDWRNRNQIKTPKGLSWLTIPVEVSGKYFQKINETKIAEKDWAIKHWNFIKQNYNKAAYFKELEPFFEDLFLNCSETLLSLINYRFIKSICDLLEINTKIIWSSEFNLAEEKTERLVNICQVLKANAYYTGPSAKGYMNETLFEFSNIELHYFNYSGYKEYNQLFPPFTHTVSIIDSLMNIGILETKNNFIF